MAITPADIEQLTFSPQEKGKGYDTNEVDEFLEQLSVELDQMLQKIADLKNRLNMSEQRVQQLTAELTEAQSAAQAAPVAMSAANDYSPSERQISQVLIVAQQSADRIVSDARESAEQIRTEADQKAREVIRQALAEKQSELDEIDRLKASREEFRSEYKKLLQHFIDDAEAVMPVKSLVEPNGSKYSSGPSYGPLDVDATVPAAQAGIPVNVNDLD